VLIIAFAHNLLTRVSLVRPADLASREFRSLGLGKGVHAFLHLFLMLGCLGQESIDGDITTKLVDMQNVSLLLDQTKGGQHTNMNSVVKVALW